MVVHSYNPSTWEAEIGGSGVQCSDLQSETTSKHKRMAVMKTNGLYYLATTEHGQCALGIEYPEKGLLCENPL
jgi:hypothetical protein